MTTDSRDVVLPRFARRIGVLDVGSDATTDEPTGVLTPFGGLLRLGVPRADWSRPALSHLALGSLLAGSLTDRQPGQRGGFESATGTDAAAPRMESRDLPGTERPAQDDDTTEPRVRDLLAQDRGTDDERGAGADGEAGDALAVPERRTETVTRETVERTVVERRDADRERRSIPDREEATPLSPDSEGGTPSAPAPGDDAPSTDADVRPAQSPLDAEPPRRDGPSEESNTESSERARRPALSRGRPAMTVTRQHTVASGSTAIGSEPAGSQTADGPRGVRAGGSGSPASADMTGEGRQFPMPSGEASTTATTPPAATASAATAPAGDATDEAPRLTVRQAPARTDAGDGADPDADAGGPGTGTPPGVSNGRDAAAAGESSSDGQLSTQGRSVADASRGSGGSSSARSLAELVDVDRLTDRLYHEIERKRRIERERQGR